MVHNYPETLGDVIKEARQRAERTMEELAISVGITERYLYRIENEGKKPSFDVLYNWYGNSLEVIKATAKALIDTDKDNR